MQNLFSVLYKNEDSLAKIVLDTNVVIDLYCSEQRSIALQQDFLREYVDYHISPDVLSEINKQNDKAVRNDQREYAKSHFTILYGIDENRVTEISNRITLQWLQSIANSENCNITMFWENEGTKQNVNSEWAKQNIKSIKAPILARSNYISIFSPDNIKEMEFLGFGEDIERIIEKL